MRVGMLGTIDHIDLFGKPAAARDDINFVGIAEADEERGEKVASQYGTRRFATADALLEQGVEAVGIFTPFTNWGEEIARYLDAGLHVFTDKPATINREGLNLIRGAAGRNTKLKLTMGLVLRGRPPYLKMKSLIGAGAIGEVVTVISRKAYTLRREQRPLFMFDASLSGGEWVELAVHDVDLVSWLLDRNYTSVTATHGNRTSPAEPYQDHGAGLLSLEGGITAFIQHDRLSPSTAGPDLRWHMTVVGTSGVIDLGDKLRLWNNDGPALEITDLSPEVSFFDNFVEAIRGGAELIVKPDEIYSVTSTVLAAYDSASDGGRPISLPISG